MVAASGLLLWEGVAAGGWGTAAGVLLGLAFTALLARAIAGRPDVRFEALGAADARKALLIVGVMTVHSVAEGIGVGVPFADTQSLGLATALAIAVHNIPEGLAISLVLVPRGVRVLHAAGWSIFSSLPQPLLAVPAFAFVAAFSGLLPVGLGFAAGAMLWMVAAELLPDAFRAAPAGARARVGRSRNRRARCVPGADPGGLDPCGKPAGRVWGRGEATSAGAAYRARKSHGGEPDDIAFRNFVSSAPPARLGRAREGRRALPRARARRGRVLRAAHVGGRPRLAGRGRRGPRGGAGGRLRRPRRPTTPRCRSRASPASSPTTRRSSRPRTRPTTRRCRPSRRATSSRSR